MQWSILKKSIFALNLVVFLFFFNKAVVNKEATLESGQLILLKLYPVDPRSLMQGDYMNLSYEMTRTWRDDNIENARGYCVLQLDDNQVASFVRLQAEPTPKADNEVLVKYYYNGSQVRIGAESYFFEEGTGEKYSDAEYGALRVDEKGNSILVGLYDENQQPL